MTKKKVMCWCWGPLHSEHYFLFLQEQIKDIITGMGDRRLGVFESEAQEQELSQVKRLRELLREAQGWLQGAGQTIDILSDAPGAPRANTDDGRQRVHAYRAGLSAYLNKISTQLAGPVSEGSARRSATRSTGAGGKGGASGTEAAKVQTETPRPECTLTSKTGRGDWASATGPAPACIVAGGSSQARVPRAQVLVAAVVAHSVGGARTSFTDVCTREGGVGMQAYVRRASARVKCTFK
jgi:hypothetical protein